MIEELRISRLGVIDEAVLELDPGLTVVTGETGAGKTMIVTGLGLLFGGRADSGLVRAGASRAAVDGRLRLPAELGELRDRLDEIGADLDDDALFLSRVVGGDGRSRAQVGGRSAPVGVLAELADDLVAVHGQTDQLRLRSAAHQRDAIDRFGGADVGERLTQYAAVYREYLDVETALTTLTEHARERAREADLLRFGLSEIETANPLPGEETSLAADVERLSHADTLRMAATGAHALLAGDPAEADSPDSIGLVAAARSALERVADHDPALAESAKRLAEAGYLLSDVAADLASYAESLEADPRRLATAQDRQAVLRALARKYADDGKASDGADGALAWAQVAAERLAALDTDDSQVEELSTRSERLRARLTEVAADLSAARRRTAQTFGAAVTAELRDLAMPHATVTAQVTTGDECGPHGADDVELLLVPHPGAPARPIAKGASGGELSRVMLAVEVVFAGQSGTPTFVFDEVDAGVGGRAAVEVGRRLARLARRAQVIVVTHLPQVAAFADRHLVVVKSDDGAVTSSGVVALDEVGRVAELSRMLAGLDGSALAQGHAGELLEAAASFKAEIASAKGTTARKKRR
jgi:DNA repair protein RecN (Recombination protein N)